jgi:hypothetical protein
MLCYVVIALVTWYYPVRPARFVPSSTRCDATLTPSSCRSCRGCRARSLWNLRRSSELLLALPKKENSFFCLLYIARSISILGCWLPSLLVIFQ